MSELFDSEALICWANPTLDLFAFAAIETANNHYENGYPKCQREQYIHKCGKDLSLY